MRLSKGRRRENKVMERAREGGEGKAVTGDEKEGRERGRERRWVGGGRRTIRFPVKIMDGVS